jgi:hypothetical protein
MNLFDTTVGKVIKTAIYIGVSAVVTYVIKVIADLNWGEFAALQPLVNTVLVFIKNYLDKSVPNKP